MHGVLVCALDRQDAGVGGSPLDRQTLQCQRHDLDRQIDRIVHPDGEVRLDLIGEEHDSQAFDRRRGRGRRRGRLFDRRDILGNDRGRNDGLLLFDVSPFKTGGDHDDHSQNDSGDEDQAENDLPFGICFCALIGGGTFHRPWCGTGCAAALGYPPGAAVGAAAAHGRKGLAAATTLHFGDHGHTGSSVLSQFQEGTMLRVDNTSFRQDLSCPGSPILRCFLTGIPHFGYNLSLHVRALYA